MGKSTEYEGKHRRKKQSHSWKIQWKVLAEQTPDDTALNYVALPKFLVTKPGFCSYVSKRLLCLIFITFMSKGPSTVPKQQTVVEVTTGLSFFKFPYKAHQFSSHSSFTAVFYSSLLQRQRESRGNSQLQINLLLIF